jgi:hypothetical protein
LGDVSILSEFVGGVRGVETIYPQYRGYIPISSTVDDYVHTLIDSATNWRVIDDPREYNSNNGYDMSD